MNFSPPLLVTLILPFGPRAAPFGPPPSVATPWILPSGVTRESVRRSISTSITEPSLIATGPSGNRRPDAICLSAGVIVFTGCPSWTSSLLRRAGAERAGVLRRSRAQELATAARGRLADLVEEPELEACGHGGQGL